MLLGLIWRFAGLYVALFFIAAALGSLGVVEVTLLTAISMAGAVAWLRLAARSPAGD